MSEIRKKDPRPAIKAKTLSSFVFDGWRFIVTLLYDEKKNDVYLQVSTLLGHIPLVPGGDDRRQQLETLLFRTRKHGRCRMMVNDRKMIFLLALHKVNHLIAHSPAELTIVTSSLVLEARPLLGVYKRFLVSQ